MCVFVWWEGEETRGKKGEKGQESRKYKILGVVCAFWHSPEAKSKTGMVFAGDTALCEVFSLHPTTGTWSLPLALQCWAPRAHCWTRQHRGDKHVQPPCSALTTNAGLGQIWVFLLNFCSAETYPFLCVYICTHPLVFLFLKNTTNSRNLTASKPPIQHQLSVLRKDLLHTDHLQV